MGSFNIKAFCSNLPIVWGDEVVVFLSIGSNVSTSEYCGVGIIDIYASPISFPIYCKYWDYGEFSDIKRDRNVEIIEEYFGMSIEDIFEVFTSHSRRNYTDDDIDENTKKILNKLKINENDKEKVLTICAEHMELYEELARTENVPILEKRRLSVFVLKELGFIEKTNKELGITFERTCDNGDNKVVFLFPNTDIENPTYLLKESYGTFILYRIDENKLCKPKRFKLKNWQYESEFIYSVNDIIELAKNKYNIDIQIPEYMFNKRYYDFLYEKSAEKYLKNLDNLSELLEKFPVNDDLDRRIKEDISYNRIFGEYDLHSVVSTFQNSSLMLGETDDFLKIFRSNNKLLYENVDGLKSLVGDMIGFEYYLSRGSKDFTASLYYSQDYSWKREVEYNNIIGKFLEKKYNESDEC